MSFPSNKNRSINKYFVGRPNFSTKECEALVDTVGLHYDALFGRFSSTLTNNRKNELWDDVTEKVNAVSSVNIPRSVAEVKKKYQVLKSSVKKIETNNSNEMKKTGGGSAILQPQNTVGEKILALVPRVESSGIEGGIDISKMSTVDTAPLNLISVTGLIPIGDTGSRTNKPADASEENAPHFFKKQTKRPLETTLFALQAKQVKLLETQTMQLAQIVDLLAERNSIEKEKLQIMKNN
ncbi:uncharacterized protein LOC118439046 [Folsomia candida]|uniref:uncharacterized protein LOC118439046 n=1 Tax=Folsomia candida TaxID=158441 RepID=UPI0016050F58|nr:uncharacterized protein LOC118439046 [Folsomia candida]